MKNNIYAVCTKSLSKIVSFKTFYRIKALKCPLSEPPARGRLGTGSHYSSAMTSTSTRTFLGNCFAATQERAGLPTKYLP